jgi:regulation of enolase protein 1 (concanavalin A-like superfamily)
MNIRPEPPKLKIEEPRVGPIGPLIDLDRDCKVSTDEEGFTIETPGKPHIITPEKANAPRALEKVTGDFVAEVQVPGEIRPGVNPLKQFPFTFQGAGLLLWVDQENYIRLERTVMYEAGSRHQVMVESFKGGKPGRPVNINVKGEKITLRMERHGGEINCTYSSDGKTWLPVRRWAAGLPPTVLVGVSATNISPKPFEARFNDFSLKHAGK